MQHRDLCRFVVKSHPMRFSTAFLSFLLFLPCRIHGQLSELEPNEDIATATAWTYGQSMSGSECNPPAFDADYFLVVLPSDGVITFTVTTQGSGTQPGTLQFALFPKYGVYQQYHTLAGDLVETTVSFSHSCLSGDTMYVRLQQENPGDGSCISYMMSYVVASGVFANDPLPNDDFANPQPVALGVPFEGHMNHLYDNTADHYGVTLPEDGVLRIIAEAEHAGTESTGTVEMYVNVNNGYYYPSIGASGVVATDTFYVPCIAAQLVTVRVQMGNGNPICGVSYRLRFDHTPHLFANDPLPNDDFANPQPIALDTPIEGHLDHFGETTADHYGIDLPDDGTLRIIAEAEQYGTTNGSTIEIYVNTLNSYCYPVIGGSSVAVLDTFYFECIRAGATTIRVQPGSGASCGISYRLRFDVLPPVFGNDPEPNEGAEDATVVAPDTDQDGHITYAGTSAYDHFKLWKGFAGTMRVIFSSSIEGPSPALNIWTLNANVNEAITTGVGGDIASDTVYVTTADPDTIVLRVSAVNFGYCGSYRFRYESGPVGMDDHFIDLFTVWPNPSADGLFKVSAAFVPTWMEVRDVQGRMVAMDRTIIGREWTLDLSQEPAGVYALRVGNASGNTATTRLVLH